LSDRYDCCIIGSGVLARVLARFLLTQGRSCLLIAPQSNTTSLPAYLALTQKSVSSLQDFGLQITGTPINSFYLYSTPQIVLHQYRSNTEFPLGVHVESISLLKQAQSFELPLLEAKVLSMSQSSTHEWELNTSLNRTIRTQLCFDFSGLYSPLRYCVRAPLRTIKLQAFQAKISLGIFPSLAADTAYQYQCGEALWAFLPVDKGRHYVVQTTNLEHAEREFRKTSPVIGELQPLTTTQPHPIACVINPFNAFGALLGTAAYCGHPNVASTFNTAIWQLEMLKGALCSQKNTINFYASLNHKFNDKTSTLIGMSGLLNHSSRSLIAMVPSWAKDCLIEHVT
jgi:hypothetical protein